MGIGGKWKQYLQLKADPSLAPHLPETHVLSWETFKRMMDKHPVVFIKPNGGSQGRGIVIVERHSGKYVIQKDSSRISSSYINDCWRQVQKRLTGGNYIIQRGVAIAHVYGRPFDVRVMIQRDGHGKLRYTGMLAKVAGTGFRVTNVGRSHGRVIPIEEALAHSLGANQTSISQIKQTAVKLSERIVRTWGKNPRRGEYGMDLAIDKNGRVWIIEANIHPALHLFRGLKDKTYYNRIYATLYAFRNYLRKK